MLHTACAVERASHDWQYSSDGGKTWISAPSSLQAKTTLSGLTPLTTVMVRQDWDQPVSAVVQ
jgi:hypothetical protein